ncbi:thiol-disulfide oxidoreductase ResA [Paenibacillus apiarius]|uniref:thiol-disulfide oxidoreductase ResA n=1 Tax=Paenibacillus apiarius TaxID=46240 RepID=UPI00197CEC35|nr:thiol-disulfide oxidoreductase ResA [Paenibacillus apiarius]MBN3527669.1 thiol-disulfide oxidoreductase ResA [Paenibacillus apiarius]
MGKRNKTIQITILVVILVLGGFAVSSAFKKPEVPKEGSMIPDLPLQQLNGSVVKLGDYKGKALALNFWGSWCEPCEREMPALQKAADEWKAKNVEIVGINYGEDPLVVQNYMKKVNVHFTMLLDQKKKVTEAFGIRPLPTTFFVKPDGKVHAIHIGELTESQLNTYLQEIAGQ